MKRQLAIFGSDQVNRAHLRFPASGLMESEERSRIARKAQGLPAGLPTHIQHDMHRLVGWSHVLGHMIDGSMVRVIGLMEQVETDEEKAELAKVADKYWEVHHEEGMESAKLELADKLRPHSLDEAQYLRTEAYTVSSAGLAAELYPEFFDKKSDAVDKDGLTDYRALTKRMKQLHPGVFQDPEKGVILFAHRFFRRSLSHRNKLNGYFLQSFDEAATQLSDLTPRLRLDPDLIGHPATVTHVIELEHWHGPKFNDNIEAIPSGASAHRAEERVRFHEGVDKTHFWWKSPETRNEDEAEVTYRTFEVEELIENASGGLADERFGCRYAHAEFSPTASAITHFDGAIRAYPADAYLERIEKTIDRAGKHSEYTKLFRFDGPLPVERWKRLLSDYFRGNPLIPEYLGASGDDFEAADKAPAMSLPTQEVDKLCAFIGLEFDGAAQEFCLEAVGVTLPDVGRMLAVETGCGAIDEFLRSKADLSNVMTIGSTNGVLNLARMRFGASESFPALMLETVAGVTQALTQDIETLKLSKMSIAMSWPFGEMSVTLSLRGTSDLIAQALGELFSIVDPTKAPSTWIEPLSDLVKRLAPRSTPVDDLWDVTSGVLSFENSGEAQYQMFFPEALLNKLVNKEPSSGDTPCEGPATGT